MGLFSKLKGLKQKRWVRVFLLLVALALVALLLFRSCNVVEHRQKIYIIGRSANLAPLKFEGKEPNVLAFERDVINEVATQEKLQIHLVTLSDTDLFSSLNQDAYDAIIVPVEPTQLMNERYAISQPIFSGGPVLVVRQDSPVTTLQELQGRGIAIEQGSPMIFKLSQENLLLVSYRNMISALEDLSRGVIDGVILEANIAYTYTRGFYKDKLKVATAPLTDLGLRIIAHKDSSGEFLISHFDKGLKELEDSGGYAKFIDKWELIEP